MNQKSDVKLWFYPMGVPYKGNEPDFFEPASFPWAAYLEHHYPTIYDELNKFLVHKKQKFKPYFNKSLVNIPECWETLPLMVWGIGNSKLKHFPTLRRFKEIFPEVVSISFNRLESGGRVLPHVGDTNGIYRVHLGLEVKCGLPHTGFRVNNTVKEWQEGKIFIFCDAYEHEAFNDGPFPRLILSVDIIRPEFMRLKNLICIKVRTFLALQVLLEVFPFVKKTPRFLTVPVFVLASVIMKIPFTAVALLRKVQKL